VKKGQVGIEVVLSRTNSHLLVALISRDSARTVDWDGKRCNKKIRQQMKSE